MSPAPCVDLAPLAGFTVGITADRRADEQAELLRRRGAAVVLGPVLHMSALADEDGLRAATEAVVAEPPDVVVATTGIGIRTWLAAAETLGLDGRLLKALAGARIATRGPKAAAAMVQAGLSVWSQEPTEQLDQLLDELCVPALAGARVVLQEYGDPMPWAVARLEAAGATVVTVPIYRWVLPPDPEPARRLMEAAADGHIDAVTFTSPAAVRNLLQIADDAGRLSDLQSAFAGPVTAVCVGPVTTAAGHRLGIAPIVAPDRGRLGLMIRSLVDALAGQHHHLVTAGGDVVLQGGLVHHVRHSDSDSGSDDDRIEVMLTGREAAVLTALSRRPGAVIAKTALLREVWGDGDPHVVDVTVARLRVRLRPTGLQVMSLPRRGYRLAAEPVPCPYQKAVPAL